MKRFAFTTIIGLVLGMTAPAFAQTGATARVLAPADGQVVVGTVTARGEGSATAGVRSVKLFIEGTLVATKEAAELRQRLEVDYSWNTTSIRNGWYQIRVDVAAAGGGSASSHRNVRVDNAPSTPSGFTGTVKDQTVFLSWAPNPEPDISGYRIETLSGDAWTFVAETNSTSYAAEVEPGTYQYRVIALRNSPTMSGGRPSEPTSATAVTVEPPPSSQVPRTGGGTGGGRVKGDDDPRIYGRDGRGTSADVRDTARKFAGGGLSFGGLSLPGQLGLPSLPTSESFKWGSYKERLPYSLPEGGIPIDTAPPRLAALSTTKVLPLDALRWVAAGALMLVIAGLLHFLGLRTEIAEKLGASEAATS